jgi:hypothetical protein
LTIKVEDLTAGYCPECFETSQTKRYDFETITTVAPGREYYRCEECGEMIPT